MKNVISKKRKEKEYKCTKRKKECNRRTKARKKEGRDKEEKEHN
jgi:hypothetical protein